GELYAAYEQLKSELEQAGYFSEYIKKPIAQYPSSIGVVTSPQGAALQDILNIMGRRYPLARVYVYPALVQGVGAAQSIAQGIEYFNTQCITDTIIIGRGGGSIEDLWAFNERIVADAIYKSVVPVISAVGHETDFTIADFVADLRAPTPSAAAELAVPDAAELKSHINYCCSKMVMSLNSLVKVKKTQLEFLISKNLHRMTASYIDDMRLRIDDMTEMCREAYTDCISQRSNEFGNLCMKLEALSPLKVLSRGYAVAACDGGTVKSVDDTCVGDNLDLTVTDGTISCTVTQIIKN
ncbi:MAG: exodeoxyribonuclease VII large subunit, partial [Clostridia bacterium]|nr:exodeoxyribonuclease VII large subunit [Clostridia bacterium]